MASGETGLLARAPWVTRRALTVDDYHRMGEAGVLYTRHNIPEYWIVNLDADRVEVHRVPIGDRHTLVLHVGRDGAFEPSLLPGAAIPVGTLLG